MPPRGARGAAGGGEEELRGEAGFEGPAHDAARRVDVHVEEGEFEAEHEALERVGREPGDREAQDDREELELTARFHKPDV